MELVANISQAQVIQTNLDYQQLMQRIRMMEEENDRKMYSKLMDEAEDLADYIRSLSQES